VRAFFTCSRLFIWACVGTEKLAGTGNRLPQNTRLAGNPARQSRREICLNPLQNIFTGNRFINPEK
jgi:hypothetical protein